MNTFKFLYLCLQFIRLGHQHWRQEKIIFHVIAFLTNAVDSDILGVDNFG